MVRGLSKSLLAISSKRAGRVATDFRRRPTPYHQTTRLFTDTERLKVAAFALIQHKEH